MEEDENDLMVGIIKSTNSFSVHRSKHSLEFKEFVDGDNRQMWILTENNQI